MVEFALISPLFFLLLFGGIEMGLMFRGNLAIEDMTRNASRVASIQRDNPDADRFILQVIADRAEPLSGEVTKVIIFHAPTLDSDLPPACIDGSDLPFTVSNVCNSYGPGYEAVAAGTAPMETGLTANERNQWNNLGVYVEYEYQSITGIIDDITLRSSTVEVVELDL